MSNKIEVIEGDITTLKVDAIVNPTTNNLTKGHGIFKAIHQAAGPQLLEECRQFAFCATGEARITRGYNLPVKWIIHTVAPIWLQGKHREQEQLAQCYRNCLKLAAEHGVETIAFPPISIGFYRFPLKRASKIAVTEIKNFLDTNTSIKKVFLVFKNEKLIRRHKFVLEKYAGEILATD